MSILQDGAYSQDVYPAGWSLQSAWPSCRMEPTVRMAILRERAATVRMANCRMELHSGLLYFQFQLHLYSLTHHEMIQPLGISITRKITRFRYSSTTVSLPVFLPSLGPFYITLDPLTAAYLYACMHMYTSQTGICIRENTGLSLGVCVDSFRHRDLFCV